LAVIRQKSGVEPNVNERLGDKSLVESRVGSRVNERPLTDRM
jgi:hypothetical protein